LCGICVVLPILVCFFFAVFLIRESTTDMLLNERYMRNLFYWIDVYVSVVQTSVIIVGR